MLRILENVIRDMSGVLVSEKQLNYILGPRDLDFTTLFEQDKNSHQGPFSGGGED